MKRIVIAAAFAVALPLGLASAAGPFDGQYTGGSPPMGRMGCPASTATVTITDGKITGNYKIAAYTFPVSGTVAPDGTVTGKWSAYPLTGKISGSHFEGSYTSTECHGARPISLDKNG
jgi:hypothetical protein